MEALFQSIKVAVQNDQQEDVLLILNQLKKVLFKEEDLYIFSKQYLSYVKEMIVNNEYEKVITYSILLIKFFESYEHPEMYVNYLRVRSILCYHMEEFECAKEYALKILELLKGSENYSGIVSTYYNLAELALEEGQYEDAKGLLLKCERLISENKECLNKQLQFNVKISTINALVASGALDEAEEGVRVYYIEMDGQDMPTNRVRLMSLRGDIALKRGYETEAMVHYKEAQVLSERYNFIKEQKGLYQRMADVLDRMGRYKESVRYLKKLVTLNSSLMLQHKRSVMAKTKMEFFLKQKEIETKKLREKNEMIRLQTDFDFLTGVHSRRYIQEHLERSFEISKATDTVMSLMIFDIDNFKNINDTYGHLVGDQVIVDISHRISSRVDPIYKIGRMGGDEFVVCFEKCSLAQVKGIARDILTVVEDNKLRLSDETLNLTISAGLVDTENPKASSVSNMLYIADQALYKAKADGKNRFYPL